MSHIAPIVGNETHSAYAQGMIAALPDVQLKRLSMFQALRVLHCEDGAILGLWKRDAGGILRVNLGGGTVQTIQEREDDLRQWLCSDCFFTINSTGDWQRFKPMNPETGLLKYRRGDKTVTFLNAVAVDLDTHKIERTPEDVLPEAIAACDRDGTPRPSLIVFSGRGLWFLWLLHDFVSVTRRPSGHDNVIRIYKRVMRTACDYFRDLGADVKVKDAARLMRLPDSVNEKTGAHVKFYLLTGKTHSLPELGSCFGVRPQKTTFTRTDKPKSERHAEAARARNRIQLAGLRFLIELRGGGVSQGIRSTCCYVLAAAARKVGVPESKITAECLRFAQRCNPPLDEIKTRAIVQRDSKRAFGQFSYRGLIEDLKITESERNTITEKTRWLREQKPAQGTREQLNESRVSAVKTRRQLLCSFLSSVESVPMSQRSLAQMAARFLRSLGLSVSFATARADLRAITTKKKVSGVVNGHACSTYFFTQYTRTSNNQS